MKEYYIRCSACEKDTKISKNRTGSSFNSGNFAKHLLKCKGGTTLKTSKDDEVVIQTLLMMSDATVPELDPQYYIDYLFDVVEKELGESVNKTKLDIEVRNK